MSDQTRDIEESIELLDRKLGILKREYEQYFLGTRPREPILTKGEVRKLVAYLSNAPMSNTALRFKFSSICSRYMAFKRQWDETLRRIESGTYQRHQFKARLRTRNEDEEGSPEPGTGTGTGRTAGRGQTGTDLYQEYVDARRACGQSTQGVSREKLEQQLSRQKQALRKKFGDDSEFQFRVAVEDGKVRLKARKVKG